MDIVALLWAVIAACFLLVFILAMAELWNLTPAESSRQPASSSLSQRVAAARAESPSAEDTES